MFDELKDKINEFSKTLQGQILELKSKFLSKKFKNDEYDDDDEEHEEDERTLVEDIGPVLGKNFNVEDDKNKNNETVTNEEDDDFDEEDEEDDEDEAKKKRISTLIKGFAAIAVVFIALDEFVLNTDNSDIPNEAVTPKTKRKRRRRKPTKRVVRKEIKKQKKVSKSKRAENKEEIPRTKPTPKVQIKQEVMDTKVVNKPVSPSKRPTPIKIKEDKVGKNINKILLQKKTLHIGEKNPKKIVSKNVRETKLIQAVEKKILERKEYQAMKSYEHVGRGLVYNCVGGHWACVNKKSYFNCKNNEDWSKYENKKVECKTAEVYATYDDCRTIQFYNINTNKSTNFCLK